MLISGVEGDCTAYVTLSDLRGDLVSDGGGVPVLRLGDPIKGGGDGDLAMNDGDIDRFNGDSDLFMGEVDLDRVSSDSRSGRSDAVDWNRSGGDWTINGLNPGGGDTIEKTGIGGKIGNTGRNVLASSSISYNEKKDWH